MSQAPESLSASELALKAMFGSPNGTGAVELGTVPSREARQVKYWKKPDGWIGVGPTRTSDGPEYLRYLESKRYKPLPDSYGVEVVGMRGGTMMVKDGTKQMVNFIKNGGLTAIDETGEFGEKGAYLMPKEQLVVMGAHRNANLRAQRPDLADVVDVECPYGCIDNEATWPGKKRLFAHEEWRDTHIVAVHREAIASQAIGKAVADAMTAQGSGGGDIAAIVAAVLKGLGVAPQAAAPVAVFAGVSVIEAPVEVDDFSPADINLPPDEPVVAEAAEVPDVPVVATPAGGPDEKWTRAELMSYAKSKGLPWPAGAMSMKTAQWLQYVTQTN